MDRIAALEMATKNRQSKIILSGGCYLKLVSRHIYVLPCSSRMPLVSAKAYNI